MSRILDRSFKYTPAAKTNIAKTFARIRKEIAAKEAANAAKKEAPIRRVA